MGYKENMKKYEQTEIMAANIGMYAYYRQRALAFSFPDIFDRMYETGKLREHLEDIQLVMDSYMSDYTKTVLSSSAYKQMAMAEGYEQAYKTIAEPLLESEEDKMGNRWVCVKDPYNDELFMEWLTAAKIFGSPTSKKAT